MVSNIKPYLHTYRWLGMPSGFVSSNTFESHLLYPSMSILFPAPFGKCEPKELKSRLFSHLQGRCWNLKEAVATQRASHYDSESRLIWELSEQFRFEKPSDHPDFHFKIRRLFEPLKRVNEPVCSLIIDCPRNIYHWLFDGLPRLHLLEKSGLLTNTLYLDASRPFVLESLKQMGLKNLKIIDSSKYPAILAKELHLPSFILYGGGLYQTVVPNWALTYLREKMQIKPPKNSPKKIFISRKDASYRYLKEEDVLFEHMKKRGFVRKTLTTMSFKEQAQTFAGAEYIVAPHGAGLACMLFCEPGTRLLELFHPGFVQNCYWQIAGSLGLRYSCALGSNKGIDPSIRYPFSDIEMPLDQLIQSLDEMGA